jgi:hypothetical protein
MKKPSPTEAKALEVFLEVLREMRAKGVYQASILVDPDFRGEGLELHYMPNETGWSYRIDVPRRSSKKKGKGREVKRR